MRLTICIATYNRAAFIAETIASIRPQLVDGTELLIVDGASPDDTAAVAARAAGDDSRVRYLCLATNSGVDADFDRAVAEAAGEHVWLFTDDDILLDGAVATVLETLATHDPDVLVVDSEVRDLDLVRRFEPRRLRFSGLRAYGPGNMNAFLGDAGDALTFIGCAVIRRSLWLARERQAYYGSLFVHVGVIFQQPLERAVILAKSLIAIRMGNAMWSRRAFEIWMFKWPELIWGFVGYSDAAKAKVVPREPWRGLRNILTYRAYGSFTAEDYRARLLPGAPFTTRLPVRLMLATPGSIVHVLVLLKFALSRTRDSSVTYNLLVASRNSNWLSRAIGRRIGYSTGSRRNG